MIPDLFLIGDGDKLVYSKPSKWNCEDEGSAEQSHASCLGDVVSKRQPIQG
jgi:hypothetical protein